MPSSHLILYMRMKKGIRFVPSHMPFLLTLITNFSTFNYSMVLKKCLVKPAGVVPAPLSQTFLHSFHWSSMRVMLVLYASNVNPEQSFYTLEPLPKEVVLNIFSTFKDILSYPIDDAKIVIVCGHNNIFRIKKRKSALLLIYINLRKLFLFVQSLHAFLIAQSTFPAWRE